MTPTDLHPAGFASSVAAAVSGPHQVGYGVVPVSGGITHALLWSGTAESVVNLHPDGFHTTEATSVSESVQVGYGFGLATNFDSHALLWHGSESSVIDLHPTNYANSSARGVWGTTQVGSGMLQNGMSNHAMLWRGTAATLWTYTQRNSSLQTPMVRPSRARLVLVYLKAVVIITHCCGTAVQ